MKLALCASALLACHTGTALSQTSVTSVESTFASTPNLITVTGSGFGPGTSVQIGGVPATVQSATPTELTVLPAPSIPGFLDVAVSDPAGDSFLAGGAERFPSLAVSDTGLGGTVRIETRIGDVGVYDLGLATLVLPAPLPLGPEISYGLLLDPSGVLIALGSGLSLDAEASVIELAAPTKASLLGVPFWVQGFTARGLIAPLEFSFTNAAPLQFDSLAFGPPTNLTYTELTATYTLGEAITPNLATVEGFVESFGIAVLPEFGFDPLPAGLSIDPQSGTLSGSPSGPAGTTTHLAVAQNAAGSSTATLTIEVLDPLIDNPGQVLQKPSSGSFFDGGAFILDDNQAGTTAELSLLLIEQGRLVDLFDRTSSGAERLVFTDLLVGDGVALGPVGGAPWEFVEGGLSGRDRIHVALDSQADRAAFASVVGELTGSTTPVEPKGLPGLELPPFTQLARNGAIGLRFNDLLDSSTVVGQQTVRLLTGEPADVPFGARVYADPNFGGLDLSGSSFHSTRVVVDFTVSEEELAVSPQVLEVNQVGLPPSASPLAANVALRIPTVEAPGIGQFSVLRALSGAALDPQANGPFDPTSLTLDVVRFARSGNEQDANRGFLSDLTPPRVVGDLPATIQNLVPLDPPGTPTPRFTVDVVVDPGVCAIDLLPGSLLASGGARLEILQSSAVSGSQYTGVVVRPTVPSNLPTTPAPASLQVPWRESLGEAAAPCFLSISPGPPLPPLVAVDPTAEVSVRFDEPLDPAGFDPFETFVIARRPNADPTGFGPLAPEIDDFIVGAVALDATGTRAAFVPQLPLTHVQGTAETYFVYLLGENGGDLLTDLVGLPLAASLPTVSFDLDPNAPSEDTGGWALRFRTLDEDSQPGPDWRGQALIDPLRGELLPRPVQRFPAVLDRSQPLVSVMQPVATGLQTPIVAAGSRAQLIWRYSDVGFSVSQTDGAFYNLDVEGVSLSPLGGVVTSTFLPEFEMLVGHAKVLPDERVSAGNQLPQYPSSGFESTGTFDESYLPDPVAGASLVHPRELGYAISPADVFTSLTGTPMLPMPWNFGVPEDQRTFFTWRDTAATTLGGTGPFGSLLGVGVPLDQEELLLGVQAGSVYGSQQNGLMGSLAPQGVPTVGLPLITEFKSFPTDAPTLINFDTSIAVTSSNRPFFRAFSSGGVDVTGTLIQKDPDLELSPTGGFNGNPLIAPLGFPTSPRDPTVYIGQLDVVTRISRIHTVLMDAEQAPIAQAQVGSAYDYVQPLVLPSPEGQPDGTSLVLAFRGDDRDSLPVVDGQIGVTNGDELDVYGNIATGPIGGLSNDKFLFNFSQPDWADSIDAVDGLRFVQARITFVSNAATQESPALDAFGLSFRR